MPWNFDASTPVFIQIANKIRADIISGKYPKGTQIPPVRALACEAQVNPNTMQRALSLLEEEGILSSKATLGRFVCDKTEVIEKARENSKREILSSLMKSLFDFGITKEEIINYIKEETK